MKIILLGLALALVVFAFAFAQPPDTAGLVTGSATASGNIVLWLANLLSGAFATYWATKLAVKFPFVKGGVTVAFGTGLGMACVWVVGLLAAKLGFPTGLNVGLGGLGSYVVASAFHEYFQNKPKTAAPPA